MIKVIVNKKDNQINNFKIMGHAMFADSGKDIVCAAASSIIITTINGLLSLDNKSIKYNDEKELELTNIKQDEITNKLLNNMLNMLIELSNDYPKNIQIREEEK